jgi:enoyl-CoA hydratase
MDEETPIIYEKHDGIAHIVLNRPQKYNALTPEMYCRLADAWEDSARDPEIRVALLGARGDKAFCTGSDLSLSVPLHTGARLPQDEWDERFVADESVMYRALLKGFDFFKPVVVAVNGIAVAGGMELLMSTDIRIASESASFGLSEVSRGLLPSGGSLVHLPRQVGWCAAMEIVLLAEPISAQRASDMGFINWVVPPNEVDQTARDAAKKLALGAPVAQTQAKEAMVRASGRPLEEAFEFELAASMVVRQTEDAREGPRAFMEKRAPHFVGR